MVGDLELERDPRAVQQTRADRNERRRSGRRHVEIDPRLHVVGAARTRGVAECGVEPCGRRLLRTAQAYRSPDTEPAAPGTTVGGRRPHAEPAPAEAHDVVLRCLDPPSRLPAAGALVGRRQGSHEVGIGASGSDSRGIARLGAPARVERSIELVRETRDEVIADGVRRRARAARRAGNDPIPRVRARDLHREGAQRLRQLIAVGDHADTGPVASPSNRAASPGRRRTRRPSASSWSVLGRSSSIA